MIFSDYLWETIPLIVTFVTAILSSFYQFTHKWQNFVIGLLAALGLFFIGIFFTPSLIHEAAISSLFEISADKFSLFVGGIFCVSLFSGLFPVREELRLSPSFLYLVASGLGIILSNNLFTFFIFWTFQRAIPFVRFVQQIRQEGASGGGTYIVQHLFTFACFIALLILASKQGLMSLSFDEIPVSFFSWPVLILAFIIIYESHGIFPFHSWIHDVVGNLTWYEISSLILSRAGVLLFVKFLMPTLNQDPDIFRVVLLSLSIFSSIYWTVRGIFETHVSKTVTYFYIAQSSLILTGLQADMTAAKGAYLHMMVISFSGTALWSMLSYIQHYTSIKRFNQFYGLAQFYPKLATLFCLFGFCMIGVPLGASFVVEDLVITGLLESHPFLGLGHIMATCLNGILFFLVFSKLFLGQTPFRPKVKNLDMSTWKMTPYAFTLAFMFLVGILPFLFLEKIQW